MNKKILLAYCKKHIKSITFSTIIIIYIIIPIFPFIKSPYGIFSKEDAALFLNYYGTIISGVTGGALTLGGVWWTLKDAEEQKREEMFDSHKPFLEAVPERFKYDPDDFHLHAKWTMNILIKNDDRHYPFTVFSNTLTAIKLKNIGLGIAKNITFTDFDCTFKEIIEDDLSNTHEVLPYELNISYLYQTPYLIKDSFENIPISFVINADNDAANLSLENAFKNCSLKGSLKIKYSDEYNNWYSQKMNFYFIFEYNPNIGISVIVDYIYLEDSKKENKKHLIGK